MGKETSTNVPFCNAGLTSTRFPRRMPIRMAREINTTRMRSRKTRELKGESLDRDDPQQGRSKLSCFSTSLFVAFRLQLSCPCFG